MAALNGASGLDAVSLEEQASDIAALASHGKIFFKSDGLYAVLSDGTVIGPMIDATGTIVSDDQAANTVLAGPTSGIAAEPTFRALVADDIPDLPASIITSGALGIANGGTGQTTQTAAMDALSPTTTKGDLLVDDGANVIRLAVGTNGQVLKANSGAAAGVEWDDETGGGGGIETIVAGTNITVDNTDPANPIVNATSTPGGGAPPSICEGRLTLTSATPITTSDVTGAGTLYFTPFRGNNIGLYDGASAWAIYAFSEVSLALTLTDATNYDIFIYDNAGTLTLEAVAWTNDTTRATALVLQDGIYVKSGATARRYLGTIRASGTNTTEDSVSKRFVWNMYNRVERGMRVTESTDSWTYNSSTYRSANNSTANRVQYVAGLSEDPVSARVIGTVLTNSTTAGNYGIGVSSTSVDSSQLRTEPGTSAATGFRQSIIAEYSGYPGAGFYYLQWLESARVGTATFYGDLAAPANQQAGMTARILA